MKIGWIGLGNMASALIGGVLKHQLVLPQELIGSDKLEAARQRAQESFGMQIRQDNSAVVREADLIVLAVKPQFLEEVVEGIRQEDWTGKTLASLAPGKSIGWYQEHFGFPVPVIRCMPNTPALVGEGCTGICLSPQVKPEAAQEMEKLLRSCGMVEQVPERLMDTVVGLSGSSPAYVFLFLEALADAAVADGMPRAQAYRMAAQAVAGSAKLALESGKHPGELKDMVCSPGGTTIQAVKVLEEKGFRGAVMDAVERCIEKSRSL